MISRRAICRRSRIGLSALAAALTLAATAPTADAAGRIAPADSFTLPRLADALHRGLQSKKCLRFCITGACLRLNCLLGICQISASPRIRHRLPDLIVSSWNRAGHPWSELSPLMRQLIRQAGLSSGTLPTASRPTGRRAEFREADVVGNPLATVALPGLCRASTAPWQPHYSSLADAHLWRSGLTEMLEPATWLPTAWLLGGRGRRWGSLFPRKGFSHHSRTSDGALVSALRALDIAEQGGVHVRWPIASVSSLPESVRRPHSRAERLKDACWQQVHPQLSSQCHPATPPAPQSAPGYAWQVWTEYQCCLPGPGKLVGTVDFAPVCFD